MSRMLSNKLREMINSDMPTLGTRIQTANPISYEIAGASGNFDYVEFTAEYAPVTQLEMENICRACELHGMASMIKVDFQNRAFIAQKAVAAGFQAVLFTDIKTPDEVRETIFAMKSDSPSGKGRFGYPNRRWIGYQPNLPQMDHAKRVDDIVIAFMIEKKEAMDYLEEICSIPGIDMLQFGPSDYSMSVGKNLKDYFTEVMDVQKKMVEIALKHNIRPRIEIYGKPEEALPWIKLGVRDFIFSDDSVVYKNFVNKDGKEMRSIIDGIK